MIKLHGYTLMSDLFNGTGRVRKPDGSEQMVNLSIYGGFVDYVSYCLQNESKEEVKDEDKDDNKNDLIELMMHNIKALVSQNSMILSEIELIKKKIQPGQKTKQKN